MSWLARSIADTLLIDDDDDDNENNDDEAQSRAHSEAQSQSQNDAVRRGNVQGEVDLDLEHRFDHNNKNNVNNNYDHNDNNDDDDDDGDDDPHGRGVKEDLSEFTETLTRQLWGVASFLAPPPPPPPPPPLRRMMGDMTAMRVKSENELEEEEKEEEEGEYEEEEEEEDVENLSDYVEEDAVGITEEALAFAQNIAHHPETWLDFPLLEEEDFEDFEISDTQHKHALAIERLAPRLAALRIEFCPAHMSEGYFWMVYFVLLHPRLNKHDADLLSTPQLVRARATWMQELQKQTKPETDWFGRKTFYSQDGMHSPHEDFDPHLSEDSHPRYMSHTTYAAEPRPYHATTDFNTEEHPVECDEVQFSTKSVEDPSGKSEIEKELLASPSDKVLLHDYDDDDGDDWLEETARIEGFPATGITVENEEDVSFSDLEEDSDWTIPVKSK